MRVRCAAGGGTAPGRISYKFCPPTATAYGTAAVPPVHVVWTARLWRIRRSKRSILRTQSRLCHRKPCTDIYISPCTIVTQHSSIECTLTWNLSEAGKNFWWQIRQVNALRCVACIMIYDGPPVTRLYYCCCTDSVDVDTDRVCSTAHHDRYPLSEGSAFLARPTCAAVHSCLHKLSRASVASTGVALPTKRTTGVYTNRNIRDCHPYHPRSTAVLRTRQE